MSISHRERTLSAVIFLGLSVPTTNLSFSLAATSIYSYTDDSGVLTFTTELDAIPEKYRSRLTPHFLDTSSASSSSFPSAEPPPPSAHLQVVTASGEYRMGDHDTRSNAVRLALEAAKKDALEQVGTYLESVIEIREMDVTRNDTRAYAAGIIKVIGQTITTRLEGDTVVIRADLTAEVDPTAPRANQ